MSIFAVAIDGIRYTLNTSNHTATVTGWDSDYGYLGDVVIPEEIIDNEENGSWFTWQKTSLKEIILGKEVASIAQDAFKYCKTITTIKEVDGAYYESINGSFVFPS